MAVGGRGLRCALVALAASLAFASGAEDGRSSRGSLPPLGDDELPNRIEFVAATALTTVRGRFDRWDVRAAQIEPARLASSFVELEIDLASISTGAYRRDDHLRGGDFFEIAKHPTAAVRVEGVRSSPPSFAGQAHYRADFVIEIKGNRHTLEGGFVVVREDPLTVEGQIELDRVAFGVGAPPSRWNPMSIRARVPVSFRAVLDGATIDGLEHPQPGEPEATGPSH